MKEVVLTSQEKCLTPPQFFAAPLPQRRMDRFLKQLLLLPTRILGSRLPFKGWARSGIFLARCLFLHGGAAMFPWTMLQGLERMLRVKARLETVSARRCGVSGGASPGCGGETVFKTAHATAGESTKFVELHEVHESEVLNAQAQKFCSGSGAAETAALATAGESKGIVGLREVNESDRFGTDAVVAAATAGESEGTIRLLEVFESEFPPLPNSSHAHNSCLRLSTSACARASCLAGACAGAAARVCPVSSSSAVSAVAHAHPSTLHGAHNSWSDTVRVQGPTGTRRVKGGISGSAEDLRPVSEVEAGVNFRPAGGVRGQVAGSLPRRQPGTGTRPGKGGVVTPSPGGGLTFLSVGLRSTLRPVHSQA